MGWFENQIEERRKSDLEMLEESFARAAQVVLGEKIAGRLNDSRVVAKNTIDEILKYYRCKPVDVPEDITEVNDILDHCLRPHGLMYRIVELTEGWHTDSYGPLIGFLRDDGGTVALIPDRVAGYSYIDPATGNRVRVRSNNASRLELEAICFYRPFPKRKLGIKDLLIYTKNCIVMSDIVLLAAATLAVVLVGMILPRITKALTGPVLETANKRALTGAAICVICVALSSQLLTSVKSLILMRISTKTSIGVQSAMTLRIMSLPAGFFGTYSPGELRTRSNAVNTLSSMMVNMVLSTGLTSLTSLLYITQIFRYAPVLVVPSIVIVLITTAFTVISSLVQVQINRKQMKISAKESGISYAMISGVQKLKLAGAEKRAFAKWLNIYSESAELLYNPPMFIKINSVISVAITLASNIVMYYFASMSGIDASSYFAFTAAYGMLSGAFMALAQIAIPFAQMQPVMEMAEPFLETEPEVTENKEIVTNISGAVEMDHVSFRYTEDGPLVLNDLSLSIKPGDYVAIVGKTGCGKSTLVRLLLGFEKPEKGTIYYDGRDINNLDIASLRRKIGTVLQDAGLFQGDIYSNIVISAPQLTLDEAWEAAEMAGIADDIKAMPMGMNTVIAEGQGGISGGQRQRIMIARAIAPKPKLLLFDEATSALDNKTQRQVSESLDKMGCTRVVIAHRLSTIRHCNRILVIDGGRIMEQGTYDELIAKGGFFAELVERQRLEAV
ncbi:MAG: NHLP bacteriocin export ABC transporter permease/ATPase subunit [Lachnospiraceae bacterium]|nr:NHLP bacteriocin export ABC transporter permease/ATPase subunit [Lachnospiraceae bacterium]